MEMGSDTGQASISQRGCSARRISRCARHGDARKGVRRGLPDMVPVAAPIVPAAVCGVDANVAFRRVKIDGGLPRWVLEALAQTNDIVERTLSRPSSAGRWNRYRQRLETAAQPPFGVRQAQIPDVGALSVMTDTYCDARPSSRQLKYGLGVRKCVGTWVEPYYLNVFRPNRIVRALSNDPVRITNGVVHLCC